MLETAHLNEAELAEYCRSKGLFLAQIAAWRTACQDANAHQTERDCEQLTLSKSDRKEIKQLKKDLQRKEKALAEAAALIILRKKAQAIWGGARGRLIGAPDRQLVTKLIEDAVGRVPARKGLRDARYQPAHLSTLDAGRRQWQDGRTQRLPPCGAGRQAQRRRAAADPHARQQR